MFRRESSITVGLSTMAEAGRRIFKLSASTNRRGERRALIAWQFL